MFYYRFCMETWQMISKENNTHILENTSTSLFVFYQQFLCIIVDLVNSFIKKITLLFDFLIDS